MEAKGKVNQYNAYPSGHERRFTINMSAGTTPFMKMFDGIEYASQCYRLTHVPLVTHAWYRPKKDEFDKLDKDMQNHILMGGLCFGKLEEVKVLQDDPVTDKIEYEAFQEFCLGYYGRRLPKMEVPVMPSPRS